MRLHFVVCTLFIEKDHYHPPRHSLTVPAQCLCQGRAGCQSYIFSWSSASVPGPVLGRTGSPWSFLTKARPECRAISCGASPPPPPTRPGYGPRPGTGSPRTAPPGSSPPGAPGPPPAPSRSSVCPGQTRGNTGRLSGSRFQSRLNRTLLKVNKIWSELKF